MAWDIPPTSALLPYHGVGDLSQWVPSMPAQNNHSRSLKKIETLYQYLSTTLRPIKVFSVAGLGHLYVFETSWIILMACEVCHMLIKAKPPWLFMESVLRQDENSTTT